MSKEDLVEGAGELAAKTAGRAAGETPSLMGRLRGWFNRSADDAANVAEDGLNLSKAQLRRIQENGMTRAEFEDLPPLQRAEILRGPQSAGAGGMGAPHLPGKTGAVIAMGSALSRMSMGQIFKTVAVGAGASLLGVGALQLAARSVPTEWTVVRKLVDNTVGLALDWNNNGVGITGDWDVTLMESDPEYAAELINQALGTELAVDARTGALKRDDLVQAYRILADRSGNAPAFLEQFPMMNAYFARALGTDPTKTPSENLETLITDQRNSIFTTLTRGGPDADRIIQSVHEKTGIPLAALISSDPQTRLQAAPIFNTGTADNEIMAVRRLLAGGQEGGENLTMAQFTETQSNAITQRQTSDFNNRYMERYFPSAGAAPPAP